jgi:hypothetical protein
VLVVGRNEARVVDSSCSPRKPLLPPTGDGLDRDAARNARNRSRINLSIGCQA